MGESEFARSYSYSCNEIRTFGFKSLRLLTGVSMVDIIVVKCNLGRAPELKESFIAARFLGQSSN